jgi:hypothetical protein
MAVNRKGRVLERLERLRADTEKERVQLLQMRRRLHEKD